MFFPNATEPIRPMLSVSVHSISAFSFGVKEAKAGNLLWSVIDPGTVANLPLLAQESRIRSMPCSTNFVQILKNR